MRLPATAGDVVTMHNMLTTVWSGAATASNPSRECPTNVLLAGLATQCELPSC